MNWTEAGGVGVKHATEIQKALHERKFLKVEGHLDCCVCSGSICRIGKRGEGRLLVMLVLIQKGENNIGNYEHPQYGRALWALVLAPEAETS